jgi:hypothetical protein
LLISDKDNDGAVATSLLKFLLEKMLLYQFFIIAYGLYRLKWGCGLQLLAGIAIRL